MSSEVPFLAADVKRHQELRENLSFLPKLQAECISSNRSSTANYTANIEMVYSVNGFCYEFASYQSRVRCYFNSHRHFDGQSYFDQDEDVSYSRGHG